MDGARSLRHACPMQASPAPDVAPLVNQHLGGWNLAMGLSFTSVTASLVVGELTIGGQHLQPYGIVHGGVHAGIIEAACSTGAAVYSAAQQRTVVGLENATSFLRACRGGTLRVTARAVTQGKRSQVWEATVADDAGKLVASGKVRLLCLEPGASLAGSEVKVGG